MENAPNNAETGVPDGFIGPMAYRCCTTCGETKPLLAFSRHTASRYRRNPVCKACNAAKSREYFHGHKEVVSAKAKEYRAANADALKKSKAEYFQRNKSAIVAKRRAEREADPDRYHAYWAEYYAKVKDKPEYREYRQVYRATAGVKARKLEQNRASRYADPQKAAQYQRQYREANRERLRAKDAQYYANSVGTPESRLAQARQARARYIGSGGFISWAEFRSIARLARDVSAATGVLHVVDHIYPLVSERVCGLNTFENLRVVPAEVNKTKFNKLLASLSHEHCATDPWEVYDDVE